MLIALTGTDNQGNAVDRSVVTDADGLYSFTNLQAGTYQLHESQLPRRLEDNQGLADGLDYLGTVNGDLRTLLANDLFGVTLNAGEDGINYNFAELYSGS